MVTPLTLEQAKNLKHGDMLYAIGKYNADGTAMRLKVSGKPVTWKTRPSEVRVPYKRGMYEYGYITDTDLDWVSLQEPEAVSRKKLREMM